MTVALRADTAPEPTRRRHVQEVLHPPGTQVLCTATGRVGTVMPYDTEYATCLPIRLRDTGQWILLSMFEVKIIK